MSKSFLLTWQTEQLPTSLLTGHVKHYFLSSQCDNRSMKNALKQFKSTLNVSYRFYMSNESCELCSVDTLFSASSTTVMKEHYSTLGISYFLSFRYLTRLPKLKHGAFWRTSKKNTNLDQCFYEYRLYSQYLVILRTPARSAPIYLHTLEGFDRKLLA